MSTLAFEKIRAGLFEIMRGKASDGDARAAKFLQTKIGPASAFATPRKSKGFRRHVRHVKAKR